MVFVGLFSLLVIFGSMMAVGYAIFSPFHPITLQDPQPKLRVQLTDILAIFLPFQIGFGLFNLLESGQHWQTRAPLFVTVVLLFVTGLSWFYGMRLLWRMKTRKSTLKRFVLLGLVMPLGIVVSGGWMLFIFADFESAIELTIRGALFILVVIGLRRLGIWIISSDSEEPLTVELKQTQENQTDSSPQQDLKI